MERAPNRLLSFDDLNKDSWRRVLREMEEMLSLEEACYLHPSKRWEYPWALERAGLEPGSRVLDAGCGGSIFPLYLASIGLNTVACDLVPPPLIGRSHRKFIKYIRGDLAALPLADSFFDAIFCISVIEHLEEKDAFTALRELRRVLRPGGRLLLTTDYFEDSDAEIWFEGPGRRFRVDWQLFDENKLLKFISGVEGFELDGLLDLSVDWTRTREAMRRFHGYPYTSVGIALVKNDGPAIGLSTRNDA